MATTSRALTLKLLADITDFTKGIDQSQKQVTTMGDKIGKFGKAAGVALLAAGAAAVAFGAKALLAGEAASITPMKSHDPPALTKTLSKQHKPNY